MDPFNETTNGFSNKNEFHSDKFQSNGFAADGFSGNTGFDDGFHAPAGGFDDSFSSNFAKTTSSTLSSDPFGDKRGAQAVTPDVKYFYANVQ